MYKRLPSPTMGDGLLLIIKHTKRMKKVFTLILVAVAMCVTLPANAQFKFGLKGGLNITNMSFSEDVLNASNRTGFFIGPTVKFTVPVVGIGLDASALFDQREAEVNDKTIKKQAINIPVNLRYGIGLGSMASIYFAAGPQWGFNIGSKNYSFSNTNWKFKDSEFSVNVGAGVMLLSHLQIGANYNIVCGKSGETTIVDGVQSLIRGRSNSWQISAAYYF